MPVEVGPAAHFADDLSAVATDDGVDLRFAAEAVRERRENLLLVRSAYRQPFGTFSGALPGPGGPLTLAEGWGVMEQHTRLVVRRCAALRRLGSDDKLETGCADECRQASTPRVTGGEVFRRRTVELLQRSTVRRATYVQLRRRLGGISGRSARAPPPSAPRAMRR